jgi:hypothetical protein
MLHSLVHRKSGVKVQELGGGWLWEKSGEVATVEREEGCEL